MRSFNHRTSDLETGRSIEARVTHAGDDIVVVVTGGARPHVGSLVLAQPFDSPRDSGRAGVSCSVLTIPPHKEEPVARSIAEAICEATGHVTVVTAGIHDDNLDAAGVKNYLALAQQMAAELSEAFK